jgi:Mrp family chromosome partitioning ATPase
MLEALKSKETSRQNSRDKPFFEDTIEDAPSASVDHGTSIGEAIPYIEVGPNKKMEGSAQVMAVKHAPQLRVQPPHHPVEKIGSRQANIAEPAKALAVAFEPWPSMPTIGQGIATEIITFHHPDHVISRQYGNMVVKMQEGQKAGQPQVVLLAGIRPQVGTSTVLLNLAVAAVQRGRGRVVVVDSNWRRPGLARRLGYVCAAGLQDVLDGRLALEQAVVQTSINGLHLLPAQASGDGRQLKAEAIHWLFNWLGEHFNLVLVDGPSLDAGGELSMLAASCDGAYLVAPAGESQQTQQSLAPTLSAMGARMRGLFHTSN